MLGKGYEGRFPGSAYVQGRHLQACLLVHQLLSQPEHLHCLRLSLVAHFNLLNLSSNCLIFAVTYLGVTGPVEKSSNILKELYYQYTRSCLTPRNSLDSGDVGGGRCRCPGVLSLAAVTVKMIVHICINREQCEPI